MKLPLLGGTNEAFSQDQNFQKTINWYPEKDPTGRNEIVLYPWPGSSSVQNTGSDSSRWGLHTFRDRFIYATDYNIIRISDLSNPGNSNDDTIITQSASIAGGNSTSGNIFFTANNQEQLLVVLNGYAFLYYYIEDNNGNVVLNSTREIGGGGSGSYCGTGPQLIPEAYIDGSGSTLWSVTNTTTQDGIGVIGPISAGTNTAEISVSNVLEDTTYVYEIGIGDYSSGDVTVEIQDSGGTTLDSDTLLSIQANTAFFGYLTPTGGTPDKFVISYTSFTGEFNRVTLYEYNYALEDEQFESCAYVDGYFVLNSNTTIGNSLLQGGVSDTIGKIRISRALDGSSWNTLDYTQFREGTSRCRRVLAYQGLLWAFGEQGTDVYYNSGNADFPFERVTSRSIEFGVHSPALVAKYADTLAIVSSKGTDPYYYPYLQVATTSTNGKLEPVNINEILIFGGSNYKIVSTPSLIQKIQDYWGSDLIDYCNLFFIPWKNHLFLILSLQEARLIGSDKGQTLVYDINTDIWFELDSPTEVTEAGWFGTSSIQYQEKTLVCSIEGDIYSLDDSTYQEENINGTAYNVTRTRQSALIHSEDDALFFKELEIVSDGGVHSDSMTLSWSDDGGRNFSSGISQTISDYMKFRRLGRAINGRIFKIETSSDEFCPLIDVYATVEKGDD